MKQFMAKAVLLSLVASAASAAGSSSPTAILIRQFQYAPNGFVHVWFDVNAVTGVPACNINNGNEYPYTFDSTTAGGRSMLAGLIAAGNAGVAVWVSGTGRCDLESGFETLAGFYTSTG